MISISRVIINDLKNALSVIHKRTYIVRSFKEKKYKESDKIQKDFRLIYKAPMENYLLACNYITSASVLMLGTFIAYKFVNRNEIVSSEPKEVAYFKGRLVMADDEIIYFTIGFIAINAAIRMILYKYPLRIYRNVNKYVSIFEGQLPMTKSKIAFAKGAVTEVPPTGILPWRENRFKIGNKSVIILHEAFRTLSELYDMMEPPKNAVDKQRMD